MSELDTFLASAFPDVLRILGTDSFTVDGFSGTFAGVLDRHAKSDALEEGGFRAEFDATLVCALAQFVSEPAVGKDVVCATISYRIERLEKDSLSYTLLLTQRTSGRG